MNPFKIKGIVQEGHKQGGLLGAKTANLPLHLAEERGMLKGLYSCAVTFQGKKYPGLLYYGINSLSHQDCLEVHIIDFSGELYGKEITVVTKEYFRPPREFSSLEALRVQIKEDLLQSEQD